MSLGGAQTWLGNLGAMWLDGAPPLQAIGVLVAAVVGYTLYRTCRASDKRQLPPMAPCSRMGALKAMTSPQSMSFLAGYRDKVGCVFRMPMPMAEHYVVIGCPKLAREILEDVTTVKPDFLYADSEVLFGGATSLFSARDHGNGSAWHTRRKAIAHSFHPKHVAAMNLSCAACYESWISETLEPAAREGTVMDMSHELLLTTIKFICDAGFAAQVSTEAAQALLDDLECVMPVAFRIFPFVPFSARLWWTFPAGRACMAATGRNQTFAQGMLEAYRALPASRKEELAASLVAQVDANASYASDLEKRAELLTFLVAGHDTTALSVAWILYDLANSPAAQTELRTQLLATPPSERAKIPLLAACIKESMRLNPVAAGGSLRQTTHDFTVGKHFVPKGALAHLPYGLIFTSDEHEAPLEFRPQRWLEQDRSLVAKGPLVDGVFPFSLGRRNCVGQALAKAELYTVVPLLIKDYEWEVVCHPTASLFLTNKPDGLRLRAKKATGG
ncbi:cytochrome P450 [Pavlovales sp. CCMP2436]|nr:cytochrome P450 [Pavlovales sp. CCMP2436]